MNLEKATPELFAAVAAAQVKIENATKSSKNDHFRSKYADLAEVLNTVRPVFAENGLSIIQSTNLEGEYVSVTTVLAHKDGGYITSVATCVPAKYDAQGVGAATTYLRRYSLAAISGVAQEDDDGNSAAHNKPAPAAKPEAAISEDQLTVLRDQIKDLNADEAAFAKFLGVVTLADLPASKFGKAKAALDTKARKAAETATVEG